MTERYGAPYTRVGHFENTLLLQDAIEELLSGGVIAFHILGVSGILGNGAHKSTWDHIHAIKGGHKVRAAMVSHVHVAQMGIVDVDRIGHKGLRRLFTENPKRLAEIVGGKAHILYPITKEAEEKVPPWMISKHEKHGYGQFQVFEAYQTGIEHFLNSLHDSGVEFPVVTSLNATGTGSITDPYRGIHFAVQSGRIPIFLIGENSDRVGSFGRLHAENLSVLRDGPEIGEVLAALSSIE